ncbi:MAG TPA: hypothetical protein PLI43_05845 [Albidovulum sp.]|uniref:hypothetical protein n=1 Tax=Albidovulum sp. TaxID=1872424 RepID=UPI002BC8DDEE|nr:hypothetical protein [Albidovulum sp.]
MSIFTFGQAAALGLAIALSATTASAVTVNEGSFAGGDFSGAFGSPTAIASGVDTITGGLGSGDRDFLSFTGMATGAQTITLNLTALGSGPLWTGTLRYSTTPFTSNTSGSIAGSLLMVRFPPFVVWTTQTLSFNLGATFGGTLFLALNQQSGTGIAYSLSIPGNNPAPVPLPATALLLGGAVAGLGASRRRGRRAAV